MNTLTYLKIFQHVPGQLITLAAVKRKSFGLFRQRQTREQLATAEHLEIKKSPNCSKVAPTQKEEEPGSCCKLMHTYKQHNWVTSTYHLERKAKQTYSLRVRHYCRLWLYTVHYNDTSLYDNNTYTYCYAILYYSYSYWETKPITKSRCSWSLSQIY